MWGRKFWPQQFLRSADNFNESQAFPSHLWESRPCCKHRGTILDDGWGPSQLGGDLRILGVDLEAGASSSWLPVLRKTRQQDLSKLKGRCDLFIFIFGGARLQSIKKLPFFEVLGSILRSSPIKQTLALRGSCDRAIVPHVHPPVSQHPLQDAGSQIYKTYTCISNHTCPVPSGKLQNKYYRQIHNQQMRFQYRKKNNNSIAISGLSGTFIHLLTPYPPSARNSVLVTPRANPEGCLLNLAV